MARPKAKKIQSVVVYWMDACFHMDLKTRPLLARTYGQITFENDEYIRLAGEQFCDGSFRQYTAIPKGMIRKIVPLEHSEPSDFEPPEEDDT